MRSSEDSALYDLSQRATIDHCRIRHQCPIKDRHFVEEIYAKGQIEAPRPRRVERGRQRWRRTRAASDLVAVFLHAGGATRMALVCLSGRSKNSHFVHLFLANVPGLFVGQLLLLCCQSVIREAESRD